MFSRIIKVSNQRPYSPNTEQTESQRPSHYRYVIAGLIGFLSFSSALSMLATGPITPLIIADYGITKGTAGLLTSIIFLVHIPFPIPISMLIGRVGLKMMICLAAVAGSAPVLSFMATDSFPLLLALRAVYGMSFVLLIPAVGPLFMQWFPTKELPLANGMLIFGGSLGITTSNFIAAPLAETMGWELVLTAFGGIALLAAIAWLFLGKTQRAHTSSKTHSSMKHVWNVARNRITMMVALADAGPLVILTTFVAWIPTLYHEVHEIALTAASGYVGVMSFSGVVALGLATLLTARTRRRRPFLIIPGILAGIAGLLVLILADSIALYIAMGVLGFVCWFYLPALFTIPMDTYPDDPGRVSLILAFLISIGGIASAAAPPIVGAIADLTGSLLPGLAACAAMGWSLAIAGVLMPQTPTSRKEGKDRGPSPHLSFPTP